MVAFLLDREVISIGTGTLKLDILETGDISKIESKGFKINQVIGNTVNGGDGNLYLRVFDKETITYTPLIGVHSPSKFYVDDNKVVYKGVFKGITYTVVLSVVDQKWFYDVTLTGEGQEVDIVYGQALYGDFYAAQYVDFVPIPNEMGISVCSRGTMTKAYVEIGSLTSNVGYAIDGFEFFGLDYKETNKIQALMQTNLPNSKYQYEHSFIALQSERVCLQEEANMIFYGIYVEGYDQAIEEAISIKEVKESYEKLEKSYVDEERLRKVQLAININDLVQTKELTQEELNHFYPDQHLVEIKDGQLFSFFTPTYEHIVTKAKELAVERAHGHIIFNKELDYSKPVIASTHYMYGVFNSHIVVGNTNVNKFTSDTKDYLNTVKTSGQRILVKIENKYQTLAMPSIYEMGFNYSKWLYKIDDDLIIVKTYTTDETPEVITEVTSEKGRVYDFIILNELTMGEQEGMNPIELTTIQNGIECTPVLGAFMQQKYPYIKYTYLLDKPFEVINDSVFFEDGKHRKEPFLMFRIQGQSTFKMTTLGQRDEEIVKPSDLTFEEAKIAYREHYNKLVNNFKLELEGDTGEIEKYNATARWYTHNALIHYITPHGLEQSGGAAWGTRDVCQGPLEYFLSTQHTDRVRTILIEIFRHQYIENGGWPQWFMFDEYVNIQHAHSHGDIIVWPLRSVALYLQATGDYSILNEEIPYTKMSDFTYTEEKYTLLEHLKKEVAYIANQYIEGTHLSIYAGGDWNDSMVPSSKELCNSMVSGWTTLLTYEAYKYLAEEIKEVDETFATYLQEEAIAIKADIDKYIMIDGVPAGFLIKGENGFTPIIHPRDHKTGIRYRLLPINRGIISEFYSKEEAKALTEIVMENLYREDGAMLFSDPIKYRGGETTYFQRSEQASNVGREIGLFYVHAHLRFIEAMAKANNPEEAWMSLEKVNPILIEKSVKNAVCRQSNTYFSSSDADVKDRYEYEQQFEAVKRGEIGVKGGWRVYSSGPAIYLNQLITNCLGIKLNKGDLEIAPTLPNKYNNLKFNYQYNDKKIKFIYHVKTGSIIQKLTINGEMVTLEKNENTYGKQYIVLKKADLLQQLSQEENCIEIYM